MAGTGEQNPQEDILRTGRPLQSLRLCGFGENRSRGARPRSDTVIEVSPLVPPGKWNWFCLDRIRYRGRLLSVVWDSAGTRFRKGKGLRLLAEGKEVAHSHELARMTAELN